MHTGTIFPIETYFSLFSATHVAVLGEPLATQSKRQPLLLPINCLFLLRCWMRKLMGEGGVGVGGGGCLTKGYSFPCCFLEIKIFVGGTRQ